MYIVMNWFQVKLGCEQDFEIVWKNWEFWLEDVLGFWIFYFLKGGCNVQIGIMFYVFYIIWVIYDDFVNWIKFDYFWVVYKNVGDNKLFYDGLL